ncbi:lanthionine synthetase C family protein [Microbispora triticiradicis]|uniref:lanthionine synthetase C family protein n=1 Tax=Microbispora triticiradicis TaxID=2200763 RepID=UPI001AD789E1|nr:lanthionine synthetase C family protein [Microbispora triticiradicis]MBO4275122.1 lanthionine synthetase [Microbispora triticiradicis]
MDIRQRARLHAEAVARHLTPPHPVAAPGQSLGGGAAGIALLHIERATAGIAEWRAAHDWLAAATRDDVTVGAGACLFHGAPALAFALHSARQPGYRPAQQALDEGVAAVTRDRLDAASQRLARGDRPALAEFDLISGLTGLGAHLRRHDPHSDLLKQVLAYLVRLTEPVGALPGWWSMSSPGRLTQTPPGGHGNNGMAHGISGPLALLSLTARHGLLVPGQMDAIGRICDWLDSWQQSHHGHPWWPETVTLAEVQQGSTAQPGPLRPSWCYGTPGIARAQQLAALATGDPSRLRTAESALTGCLNDPHQLQRITDRSLCHGSAGLVMTVTAFAADTSAPQALSLSRLTGSLLDAPAVTGAPPGFLTGHAGYGLALHALACDAPTSAWDACLLLR